MGKSKKGFRVRSFVSLMAAFSALGLPVTGVANHLCGFTPMSVHRHAWMAAHNVLAVLFTVFCIWHIVNNRRALWRSMRNMAARVPAASREAMVAGTVVMLVLLLAVGHAVVMGG